MKYILIFFLYCSSLCATSYAYLTWQSEDIHTKITINFFHPEKRFFNLKVSYQINESSETSTINFVESSIPFIDYTYTKTKQNGFIPQVKYRYIYAYSVQLSNLAVDTKYSFSIFENNLKEKDGYFKTPSRTNISFVVGGDMGYKELEGLLKEAAATNPDFAIIGGDIAYVNGKEKYFTRWLTWFTYWQKYMIREDGCIIPIIAAIGNHEVNKGFFSDEAPFYFGLLSQGRKSYFSRILGNDTILVTMDSGHIVSHEEQKVWLRRELEKHSQKKFKIAVYHVPLYPSHRSFDDILSEEGRKHWLPIFDEYKLTLGFEHHDHAFKRSKILKNNVVSDEGTIYLGDGCFGKNARSVDTTRFYLEKASSVRHFWHINIQGENLTAKATDESGNTFDQLTIQK